MHRLDLRPWLVAAAGAAVLGAGVLAVQSRGGHWREPEKLVALRAAPGPQSAKLQGREPIAGAAAPRIAEPHPSERVDAARSGAEAPAARSGGGVAQQRAARAALPPDAAAIRPSFDIVRVDAQGAAVIAGRAAPGAEVVIRDDGQELGRAKADGAGQWVFLPASHLSPGSRALMLAERTPEGAELKADASVLLVVPDRKSEMAAVNPMPPLAVLSPEKPFGGSTVRLLQPPPPAGIGAGARLGLDVVQYTDHGAISFAGSAPPGTPLRVYIDNRRIGDALADGTGRWWLTPVAAISIGRHQVRVDQLNQNGRVSARVELPFAREAEPDDAAVANGKVVVQPGENLWRLARHVYGAGPRFTVIYQANRTQIRDPHLIYPGQIFAVPDAPQSGPAPPDTAPPYSG